MASTTDAELRQRIADLQRGGVRSPSVARQIQSLQQQLNQRQQSRTDSSSATAAAAATPAPITAPPPRHLTTTLTVKTSALTVAEIALLEK